MIVSFLTRLFRSKSKHSHPDNCAYFGGFGEEAYGNALPVNIYYPAGNELIFLPYQATNEQVIEQLRMMEIGEAFLINEETVGPMSGDILAIERITPKHIVRIEGKPTSHPDAPSYPVMKLL